MGDLKRIFVVSDIHGHYSLLREALEQAGFEPGNDEQLLVCCGDLFDRGAENRAVYDFFQKLTNKLLVCGNHDERLLHILRDRRMNPYDAYNGTERTVTEFFGGGCLRETGEVIISKNDKTAEGLRNLIVSMADYFETEHYVFVHGWIPTEKFTGGKTMPLPNWRRADGAQWSSARFSEWTSFRGINDMLPEKTIVCGHRPTRLASSFDPSRSPADSSIYYGKGMIALDAGTIRSGRVNVLVLEDELL